MDNASVFSAWAPQTSIWSAWAKGTVFASMTNAPVDAAEPLPPVDVAWAPAPSSRTAIILDLRAEGVAIAACLAHAYQPVVLYNALPGFAGGIHGVAVDMADLVRNLWRAAPALLASPPPADAPPLFLLDAGRRGDRIPGVGDFDNRSVSFPTDFPSGNLLIHHGISHVLLVQRHSRVPQPDLAHTLRDWQSAGVQLQILVLEEINLTPVPLKVRPISRIQAFIERIAMQFGFRRSRLGGYGSVIPIPSAG